MKSEDRGLLLVVTERRFLGDALSQICVEKGLSAECRLATSADELALALERTVEAVIVDLECAWLATTEDFAARTEGARRVGLYDRFTSERAELAFQLQLVALRPWSLEIDDVVELLAADAQLSMATSAAGLSPEQRKNLDSLTERELLTVRLMMSGRGVADTAEEMGIAPSSVRTYRRRAFRKLGVASGNEAAALHSVWQDVRQGLQE